jgi:hypothetical protein
MPAAPHFFGVRHHGPGSAHSLLQALEALQPDAILVEGPAEAEAVLPLVTHAEMRPPVALLVYAPDEPQRAVYYPLAEFSPEWQAFRYAVSQVVPLRLIDLPQSHWLALSKEAEAAPATPPAGGGEEPSSGCCPSPPVDEPDPAAGDTAATDLPDPRR